MPTALVLGAAVWRNGPSPTLRRRSLAAARLYHAGAVDRIVACGGMGRHGPTEAEVIADLLQAAGVPPDQIALERTSRSTGENIGNALALLTEADVVIVSDWYHLPRARLVARRYGLRATGHAAPLSDARPLAQTRGALREVPALLAYLLRLRG